MRVMREISSEIFSEEAITQIRLRQTAITVQQTTTVLQAVLPAVPVHLPAAVLL